MALLAGSPLAAQQFTEFTLGSGASLGTYPADCATTLNNNRAAVRYANPASNATVLSVWQLTGTGLPLASLATFGGTIGGVTLKSGQQTDLSAPILGYWPSDRIELTNSMGVSIGSGVSGLGGTAQDETYIELFDVSTNPPGFKNQFVITPSVANWTYDRAGYANDVAITRDGDWAIINSDNWIHALNLNSGALTGFNIGASQPCTPNQAVDSVAVINEVAIVTTARMNTTFGTFTTWVYLVDLTVNPPVIVLQDEITPPTTWIPGPDDSDRPHDVEILAAPDGTELYGLVTTTHGVALYDLIAFTPLPNVQPNVHLFDATDWRQYQWQVDSIGADSGVYSRYAVVIADNGASPTAPLNGKVQVLLAGSGGLSVLQAGTWIAPVAGNRAHDVAFDATSFRAIVRTSLDNVFFPNIALSATPTVRASPSGSNAHGYKLFAQQTGPNEIFSSDSAVLSPEGKAVTIGAYQDASFLWHGTVDIIDLTVPNPTVAQVDIAPDPLDFTWGNVPVDLSIGFNHSEVAVRCVAPYYSATSTAESDLAYISLTSPYGFNMWYGATVPAWA